MPVARIFPGGPVNTVYVNDRKKNGGLPHCLILSDDDRGNIIGMARCCRPHFVCTRGQFFEFILALTVGVHGCPFFTLIDELDLAVWARGYNPAFSDRPARCQRELKWRKRGRLSRLHDDSIQADREGRGGCRNADRIFPGREPKSELPILSFSAHCYDGFAFPNRRYLRGCSGGTSVPSTAPSCFVRQATNERTIIARIILLNIRIATPFVPLKL